MYTDQIHPLTRWSIYTLLIVFLLPSFLIIAYFIGYASINQTSLTPVNDIIVQVTLIYGASGIALIDLGEQTKKLIP